MHNDRHNGGERLFAPGGALVETSARILGCSTVPFAVPPQSRPAPYATASAIRASAKRAAEASIIGPTSVDSSAGSPTRNAKVDAPNRSTKASHDPGYPRRGHS